MSPPAQLLAGCARPLARQEAADVRLLLRDVSQLAEEVLPHCSGRELANMAHGFAAAGSYSRRLMQLLLGRCNLAALKPQELANLTWAVAKLNHEMHEGWTAEVLALSYQYMQNPSPRTPQGHIRTRDQVIGFKPQEMCNVAWALAVMQRRCLLCSAPPLRHSCTRVDAAWKVQFRQAAAAQLWDFQAADLAMGLWALAVLGASDAEATWLDGQLQRAVQLVGHMQGRHVAVLLWSVSQVQRQQQQQHDRQRCNPRASTAAGNTSLLARHRDSGLQQFSSACFAQLPRLLQSERQQLQLACVVLLSAAHLQLHPPASTVHMLLRAAAGQLRQRSSSSWQDMQQRQQAAMASSTITGGVGWLADQHQHQQQQQQRSVQLVDVTALLYACARLQYHPSQQFMAAAAHAAATACWQLLQHKKHKKQQRQLGQQQQQQPPPPAVHMKEVALLLWAMGKLHYQPPRPLLRLLCKATAAVLTRCTSADVGLLLWSLARLRARPRHKLVQELLAHFIVRLDDGISTAADVCNVVHALPHLPGGRNLNPMLLDRLTASGQLQQLAAAAQARFRECGPRELVGIIQGFARLGFRPGSEWMAEHELCCSRLGADRLTDREKQALTAARAALAQLPDHQLPHVAQQPPQHLQQQQLLQQQRQRVEALAGAATLV